jgi:hypothetical protein
VKKIIAILFLASLFVSQAGYHFIYMIQQHYVKEEVKERVLAGVPDSYLEIIEQNNSIQWLEKAKEFYLNGELYDVVKIKKLKNKVLLYCLNDNKEEKVLKDFEKAIKSGINNTDNGKSNKHTIKLPIKLYTDHSIQLLSLAIHVVSQNSSSLTPAIISSFKKVTVPPPRA